MKINEFEQVKDYNYTDYCDYLQTKYGIGLSNYMTQNYDRIYKVSRTSEGLFAHHKYEDHAISLSEKKYAILRPYEWQLAKNIVYCDYLEHLLLHILICENPKNDNPMEIVGIGGIFNFIVPKLNDFYSGFCPKQVWEINCFSKVKEDKNVYFALLKRFKETCKEYPLYEKERFYASYNEEYGLWSQKKNQKIYKEISEL